MKPTKLQSNLANFFQNKMVEKLAKKSHMTIKQAHTSMERIRLITDNGQQETQINQFLELLKKSDHITVPIYDYFLNECNQILDIINK